MSKTVVLIHGFGFDYRIWYPLELAFEGYHIIYLSLPGFGEEPVEEAYTITQLAQRFWSEIDKKVAPVVHLVGHSMGGYVAIEMAAQQPKRLVSLALIHSHVFADSDEKKATRIQAINEIKARGRSGYIDKFFPSLFGSFKGKDEIMGMLVHRAMHYQDSAWYFGLQAISDRKDHSETLSRLKAPVLMIMGGLDKAVSVELAYKQAPLAERSSLFVYPEVGHMAMFENSAEMIGDLVKFYDEISG